MLWETSLLDAEEGIRFRGLSIPELQKQLPTAVPGGEPIPEGLLWLLMTGDIPTKSQVQRCMTPTPCSTSAFPNLAQFCIKMFSDRFLFFLLCVLMQAQSLTEELRARSKLPPHVLRVLKALPSDTHPMTQLSTAVLALQNESQFAKAYESGVHRSKYWDATYEDAMNLIAKLPEIAAIIYR